MKVSDCTLVLIHKFRGAVPTPCQNSQHLLTEFQHCVWCWYPCRRWRVALSWLEGPLASPVVTGSVNGYISGQEMLMQSV